MSNFCKFLIGQTVTHADVGQTPQNFNKKLKRETVTLDELKAIADALDIKFEQVFILPDGNEIKTGNE